MRREYAAGKRAKEQGISGNAGQLAVSEEEEDRKAQIRAKLRVQWIGWTNR